MIIILFFIILIGAVNVSSFSIILCKEKIKDKKEHIIFFAAFMIMQAFLLAMSSFLLRNFYPIEIEYNFLRTVFIFSSTILLVFTASFVCYCLAVKNGNPNISSFGYTWCVISRIKERKKKQQDRISRSKKLLYALPGVFGIGYMLFNQRVLMSNYMPLIATGNKVILYGDYSYYWLAEREGRTLERLNELYAVTDQVGFKLTERLDGRLILPEAVKCLQMKGA